MKSKTSECELILALDVPSREEARNILAKCGKELRWVKLGLQLFVRYGPDLVKELADEGYQVFLDLKLHDIPNTVASAIRSLKGVPASMLTIHTMGGPEMMTKAAEAAAEINPDLKLLGVTVLTSPASTDGYDDAICTNPGCVYIEGTGCTTERDSAAANNGGTGSGSPDAASPGGDYEGTPF
ncbi:MAG: orotidine-5'-phosphate decarboxylase [Verrucomicrobiota bacterium]